MIGMESLPMMKRNFQLRLDHVTILIYPLLLEEGAGDWGMGMGMGMDRDG
jgi:hypothetical protein